MNLKKEVDDRIVLTELQNIILDWLSRNIYFDDDETYTLIKRNIVLEATKEEIISLIEMMAEPDSLELFLKLKYGNGR